MPHRAENVWVVVDMPSDRTLESAKSFGDIAHRGGGSTSESSCDEGCSARSPVEKSDPLLACSRAAGSPESVDAAGMVLGIDQDLRGMGGGSQLVRVAQPAGGSAEEVAPGPMLVRRVVTITTTLHAVERVIP